jgi:hypothetical protein
VPQRRARASGKGRSSSRSSTKSDSRPSGSRGPNGRGQPRGKREEFPDYSVFDPSDVPQGPDVLVDVPVVKVDKIEIEVDDLQARVAARASVRNIFNLTVGAHARLGQVVLKIEGVEAQALLKARLDNVSKILERVLLSLDRNPELLEGVGHAVEELGGGAGQLLDETGEAVENIGAGAGQALPEVGQGVEQATGQQGRDE